MGGGPIFKSIATGIANLGARELELGNWWEELPPKPSVTWAPSRLYGPTTWRPHAHFGKGLPAKPPTFSAGPIASSDRLGKFVEEKWVDLKGIDSSEEVLFYRKNIQKFPRLITLFSEFSNAEIWEAIQSRRGAAGKHDGPVEDLKLPEWQVFSNPDSAAENRDFKLRKVAPPKDFERWFESTVLIERIREVRALVGYTRIESNADFAEVTQLKDTRMSPISRTAPTWLPASEVRGEGIFLSFREDVVV